VDDSADVATAQTAIDTAETAVADDVDTNGTNTELLETLRDAIIAAGDATLEYVETSGAETLADVLAEILIALDTGTDAAIEAAVTAIAGYGPADSTDADIDAVSLLIDARAALIADVINAETAYDAVAEVEDLADVQTLVDERDDEIAAVTAAEDLVDAVTPTAEAHADAVTATTDAETAIDDAGWTLNISGDAANAGAGNDIWLYTTLNSAIITDFGFDGTDLFYFGTGYSLVTLLVPEDKTSDDMIDEIDGDVSSLEIFVVDDRGDTYLFIETNAFDGSGFNNGDMVFIELMGLTGATVSLTTSGFLSIA